MQLQAITHNWSTTSALMRYFWVLYLVNLLVSIVIVVSPLLFFPTLFLFGIFFCSTLFCFSPQKTYLCDSHDPAINPSTLVYVKDGITKDRGITWLLSIFLLCSFSLFVVLKVDQVYTGGRLHGFILGDLRNLGFEVELLCSLEGRSVWDNFWAWET